MFIKIIIYVFIFFLLIVLPVILIIVISKCIKNLICFIKLERKWKDWRETIALYLDNYAESNNKQGQRKEEYLTILEKYCTLVKGKGFELQFREGRNLDPDTLNGNAGLKRWPIVVTPLWAAKLIFENDNPDVINAFEITIGHELTHKDEVNPWIHGIFCVNLIQTLNEVRADFGGTKIMRDNKREALANSCEYKRKFKIETLGKDDVWKDHHPSWSKRLEYAKNSDFNENLIKKIADDMPSKLVCKWHINRVVRLYKEKHIILDPPIAQENGSAKKI